MDYYSFMNLYANLNNANISQWNLQPCYILDLENIIIM